MNSPRFAVLIAAALLVGACGSRPAAEAPGKSEAPEPANPAAATPVKVRFETSKGNFVVEVHPDWAPLGAARFLELVKDGYYDGARFFRVVPNFVVQFGIAAKPAMTKKWDKTIDDDPVKQTNRTGSIAFATEGPNTRTAQVFINLRSNQSLDGRGFAPFGIVTEGMDVVEKINDEYGEQPRQDLANKQGNTYLAAKFPRLDYIRKATVL